MEVKSKEKKLKKTPVKCKVRLVGDSNARGLGAMLQTDSTDTIVLTNPGAETDRLRKQAVQRWDEDVLILMGGTNDIRNKTNPAPGILTTVDKVATAHPDRRVFVVEIPPDPKHRRDVRHMNNRLRDKCNKYRNVIFLETGLRSDQMQGVHMNTLGKWQVALRIRNRTDSFFINKNLQYLT